MVERDNGTIRAVAWWELFPWLGIIRTFRLAIAARVLVLGAAGILITATGWSAVGSILGTDSPATAWLAPFTVCPWETITEAVPNRPTLPNLGRGPDRYLSLMPIRGDQMGGPRRAPGERAERAGPMVPATSHWQPHDPIASPWALLTEPATGGLLNNRPKNVSLHAAVCLVVCGLLSAAVWAFFGAAISRIAAVQLAAGEQVGMGPALRFACRKWPSYFAAPLLPLGGVLLAAIPVVILGLIMRALGLWLGIFFWPFVLLAGFLMALLLAGVLFGWPLMWATISTEGTDSFDALSRSYAYTFQRPLHYFFYAVVAGFIGWLGWLLVQNFAAGVVWMGYLAASWGCGSEQVDAMLGRDGGVGAAFIHFWAGCVKLLAVGYLFSYFWTAATAIYLLLRRDVDATEMDEVFLDADLSEPAAALPAIATDQAGGPLPPTAWPNPGPLLPTSRRAAARRARLRFVVPGLTKQWLFAAEGYYITSPWGGLSLDSCPPNKPSRIGHMTGHTGSLITTIDKL